MIIMNVRRCFIKENKNRKGMRKIYEIMMKTLPISILNHLPTKEFRYRHLQNVSLSFNYQRIYFVIQLSV